MFLNFIRTAFESPPQAKLRKVATGGFRFRFGPEIPEMGGRDFNIRNIENSEILKTLNYLHNIKKIHCYMGEK